MKQKFIIKEGNPALKIIFGGWGSSERLFSDCRVHNATDFLLCYDYTSPDFDWSSLSGYSSISLLAWSMGVWAAGQLLCGENPAADPAFRDDFLRRCPSRTAFGGTPFPIDDARGIPVAVFDGTLAAMSLPTLYKFRRRMCGGALAHFESHMPLRTLEDLTGELSAIKDRYLAEGGCTGSKDKEVNVKGIWTRALAGEKDLVFPLANQQKAWEEMKVPFTVLAGTAHYEPAVFERFLAGEEF